MKLDMKLLKILSVVCIIGIFSISNSDANMLSPSVLDLYVEKNTKETGYLEYTNTSDEILIASPEVLSYNANTEEIIEEGYVFIEVEDRTFEIEPNEMVQIQYEISYEGIEDNGTYFNVLAMISQNSNEKESYQKEEEAKFDINIGEGALFAAHFSDFGTVSVFQELTVTFTSARDWFIPYIVPAKGVLQLENKSNFVFNLEGEIKVLNEDGEVLNTKRVNSEESKMFPGDQINVGITANEVTLQNFSFVSVLGESTFNQRDASFFTLNNYFQYFILFWIIIAVLSLLVTMRKQRRKLLRRL
jgi:hypothetical protein